MTTDQAKAVSINDLLQQLGHQPVNITAREYRYVSPFRDEKTPSFHVTVDGRAWKDFGDGRGGNILDLAFRLTTELPLSTRLNGEQLKTALAFMESVVGTHAYSRPFTLPTLPVHREPVYRLVQQRSFSVYGQGSSLSRAALYLGSRGINAERFAPYLTDVTYAADDDKQRYGFGLPNVSGGYELRRYGDWKKTAVGRKDITIFKANKEAAPWHTFYSLIDFGTFLTVDKPPIGAYHYLIINSDSLIDKTIHYLESMPASHMVQYPHIDQSGQRAYDKLRDFLLRHEWGQHERSGLYQGFNDWTEAREAQLGLTRTMTSPKGLRTTPKIDE